MRRFCEGLAIIAVALAPIAQAQDLPVEQGKLESLQQDAVANFPRLAPSLTDCRVVTPLQQACDAESAIFVLDTPEAAKMLELRSVAGVADEASCLGFVKRALPKAKLWESGCEARSTGRVQRRLTGPNGALFEVSWSPLSRPNGCAVIACAPSSSPTGLCAALEDAKSGASSQGRHLVPDLEGRGAVRVDGRDDACTEPRHEGGVRDIVAAIRVHRPEIRACIEEQLHADRSIDGVISLRWIIEASGQTSEIHVEPEKFRGTPIAACLSSVIAHLSFPPLLFQHEAVKFPFALGERGLKRMGPVSDGHR